MFSKCGFSVKISISGKNFDFWPKFRFLAKTSISGQNFDFWPKFGFFSIFRLLIIFLCFGKISISDPKFELNQKFLFAKIGINFSIRISFRVLPKFRFLPKFTFFFKISTKSTLQSSSKHFPLILFFLDFFSPIYSIKKRKFGNCFSAS